MLKNLLSKLTGERYYPTTGWNKGSVVSNIFRAFEYVFGRKVGQKLETETFFFKTERGDGFYRKFHTTEAHLVFVEQGIKNFILNMYYELASYKTSIQKGNWKELMDRVVNNPSPIFNTISVVLLGMEFKFNQGSIMFPFIMGAVGYVGTASAAASNTNSYSYAVTISGSDTLVLAGHNTQAGDVTTGVTCNSAAMVQLWKSNGDTGSAGFYGYNYVYFLQAPTTGNIAISASSSGWMRGSCAVYSGVDQLAPIDNFAVKNINSTTNSVTFFVTKANCWIFTWYMQDNFASNTATPPSGYSQRSGTDSTQADSNTTVSTTDRTVAWGVNGSNRSTQIAVSFKPATGSLVVVAYQGNTNDYNNGGSSNNRAISFKVLQDVTVDKVAIYATQGNSTTGTFKLEILTGDPQTSPGVVIATTGTLTTNAVLPAYGSGNLAFTDISLTAAVALTAGTVYYLKLTSVTGSGSDAIRWSLSNPSSYLNGSAYIATSGDSTWVNYPTFQYGFQITAQASVTSQIKTVAGLAIADVKTIAGVAIASVKSLAGVSNT